MKRKIFTLILTFFISISSIDFSFAHNEEDYISTSSVAAVTGYVITKETFNIIVGMASLCGITLLTQSDKLDFVDLTLSNWINDKRSTKTDSGDFSTVPDSEIIKEIENDIKNGSSKDPNGNKLFLSSSLVSSIVSIFDLMKDNSSSNSVSIGGDIPFYPNCKVVKPSDFGTSPAKGDLFIIHLKNNDRIVHKYYNSSIYPYTFYNNGKEYTYSSDGNNWSYVPCNNTIYSECSNHSTNKQANIYHLAYLYGYPGNYYVGRLEEGFNGVINYYIPRNIYMDNYNPVSNNQTVSNDDFIGSNDNLIVDGTLDLPFEDVPEESPEEDNKIPSFPSLDNFDFSSFDFSSLGKLFDNLKNKFPFSLPFDLHNILTSFSVEPTAPIFEFSLFGEGITIDLTSFDELANIVRVFVVLGWVFGLFILTKTFGG